MVRPFEHALLTRQSGCRSHFWFPTLRFRSTVVWPQMLVRPSFDASDRTCDKQEAVCINISRPQFNPLMVVPMMVFLCVTCFGLMNVPCSASRLCALQDRKSFSKSSRLRGPDRRHRRAHDCSTPEHEHHPRGGADERTAALRSSSAQSDRRFLEKARCAWTGPRFPPWNAEQTLLRRAAKIQSFLFLLAIPSLCILPATS